MLSIYMFFRDNMGFSGNFWWLQRCYKRPHEGNTQKKRKAEAGRWNCALIGLHIPFLMTSSTHSFISGYMHLLVQYTSDWARNCDVKTDVPLKQPVLNMPPSKICPP